MSKKENLKTAYKLAKLMKLVSELVTDENVTLVSDGELEIGSEVFVADEAGELVPAPSGVYHAGELTLTVDAGVIVSIEKTEAAGVTEETPAPEVEMEATEAQKDETIDEVADAVEDAAEAALLPEETPDEKDAKIAELTAKIAELEAIIADYKEKEATPVAESVEEEDLKEVKMNADKPKENNRVAAGVALINRFKNK